MEQIKTEKGIIDFEKHSGTWRATHASGEHVGNFLSDVQARDALKAFIPRAAKAEAGQRPGTPGRVLGDGQPKVEDDAERKIADKAARKAGKTAARAAKETGTGSAPTSEEPPAETTDAAG